MGKLFEELKRRNVVLIAIAYMVLGWVSLQAADILFGTFGTPEWVARSFSVLLLLGFPVCPYFNHTLFPDLARILERQAIDRPFINGPPYQCEFPESAFTVI